MKLIRSFIIKIKIYYYSFSDFVEDELFKSRNLSLDSQIIERKYENTKLARGVKRLVERLRKMSPESRISTENLLCQEPYKKTRKEKMEELRVRNKINKNPILKTQDDLVHKVVKEAPRYALERELSEVRKSITACLKASGKDPNNKALSGEMKALKAKYELIKGKIERLKLNV